MAEHMQIGVVAERTGLSLRTIRYYEEVELVTPSARSPGGFRLYTERDVARLDLIKQMKPLGFQLEQMRELLDLLDPGPSGRAAAAHSPERLREFCDTVEQRCAELRAKLDIAEGLAATLRSTVEKSPQSAKRAS